VDPSTWVVRLRDGVKWHDGKPFTADDVVFTYTSFRDGSPNRYTHHVNDAPKIEQIVAEDARTVTFSCGYPCPSLDAVTFPDLPILPKHIWESIKEPQTYKDLPIGTGPYKLVELRPNGKTAWLHVASTQWLTWYATPPTRGREVLAALGVVPAGRGGWSTMDAGRIGRTIRVSMPAALPTSCASRRSSRSASNTPGLSS
jgi:Bacterial extracellular solute-binding proteins, family 5 Middle